MSKEKTVDYQKTDYHVSEVHFGKAVRLPNGTTVTHVIAKNAKCTIFYDGWTFRIRFDSGMGICVPTANVSQFCGEPLITETAPRKKEFRTAERSFFEPVG